MKILSLSFTFPPEANGVARVAGALAYGLAARGHVVKVGTGRLDGEAPEPTNPEIWRFDVSGNAYPSSRYRGEIAEFRDFIRSTDADVIYCHGWQTWATDLAIEMFPRVRGKKILVSHGVSANSFQFGRMPRVLINWLRWRPYVRRMPEILSSFDHAVFLSARSDGDRFYDRRLASRMSGPRCSTIPNGVDLTEFEQSNRSFRARYQIESEFMALTVGTYSHAKNEVAVVKALLSSGAVDTTLVCIGPKLNGYSRKIEEFWVAHRAEVARRGLALRLIDACPRADVVAAYIAADLFVSCSRSEYFPLMILEAMAAGTPYISSNVGCVADLPGGITFTRVRDLPNLLREKLRDREWRIRAGAEGSLAVRTRFNWPAVLEQHELLLRKVLDE